MLPVPLPGRSGGAVLRLVVQGRESAAEALVRGNPRPPAQSLELSVVEAIPGPEGAAAIGRQDGWQLASRAAVVLLREVRERQREGPGNSDGADPACFPLVQAEVLATGRQVVVDHVVNLVFRLCRLSDADQRVRAIVHIGERQLIVAAEVQEQPRERLADTRRHQGPAWTVDEARPC